MATSSCDKKAVKILFATCWSAAGWKRESGVSFDLRAGDVHALLGENIALRLEPATAARRVNRPARRTRAAQLLQHIGADFSPDAEVRSLSMPGQQLVEIACALGAGARIVIMDLDCPLEFHRA